MDPETPEPVGLDTTRAAIHLASDYVWKPLDRASVEVSVGGGLFRARRGRPDRSG